MTDAPGARVLPVPRRFARSLHLDVIGGHAPGEDPRAEAAWARMCAQNPQLFDGPILAVCRLELGSSRIVCERDSYRRLALRDVLATGVAILSVTAVLEARDAQGRPHVLMGRRGERTRSYPGLWELGPAGGLDPGEQSVLGHADILAQINTELRDETGLHATARAGDAVAVVHDPVAGSYDIVVRVRLDEPLERQRRSAAGEPWEYREITWMPIDGAGAFVREQSERIIGPTLALMRWFGWLTD